MRSSQLNPVLCVIAVAMLAAAATVHGQEATKDAEAPSAEVKQQALKWLDRYGAVQVLFHREDVDRLRDKIAKATPEQAQEWWDQTKEIREALDSRRWKATRLWLQQFLQVQAIYSDEQIEHFRTEAKQAAEESPAKFEELLVDIESKRLNLAKGSANAKKMREQELAISQAYRREQAAARDASRLAAAQASNRGVSNAPPVKRREYVRPPQIINSLDVARWSVMRGFWPRW